MGLNLINQPETINNCPICINKRLFLTEQLCGDQSFQFCASCVRGGGGGVQTTWTSPLHVCAGPDCHLHQILSERLLPSNCNLEAKMHRLHTETLLNLKTHINLLPVFQSTSCSWTFIQENRKDVHAFLTGCSRLLPPLDMRNHERK